MKENTENTRVRRIQEELLGFLPLWNYHITKPSSSFWTRASAWKVLFTAGASSDRGRGDHDRIGKYTRMPKQQVTKMVNRLWSGICGTDL